MSKGVFKLVETGYDRDRMVMLASATMAAAMYPPRYTQQLPTDIKLILARMIAVDLPCTFMELYSIWEFNTLSIEQTNRIYNRILREIYQGSHEQLKEAAIEYAIKHLMVKEIKDIHDRLSRLACDKLYARLSVARSEVVPIRYHLLKSKIDYFDGLESGVRATHRTDFMLRKDIDVVELRRRYELINQTYNIPRRVCKCRQMLTQSVLYGGNSLISNFAGGDHEYCNNCFQILYVPWCYVRGKYVEAEVYYTELIIAGEVYLFADDELPRYMLSKRQLY
jgi:hypothetical protein